MRPQTQHIGRLVKLAISMPDASSMQAIKPVVRGTGRVVQGVDLVHDRLSDPSTYSVGGQTARRAGAGMYRYGNNWPVSLADVPIRGASKFGGKTLMRAGKLLNRGGAAVARAFSNPVLAKGLPIASLAADVGDTATMFIGENKNPMVNFEREADDIIAGINRGSTGKRMLRGATTGLVRPTPSAATALMGQAQAAKSLYDSIKGMGLKNTIGYLTTGRTSGYSKDEIQRAYTALKR